MPYLAQLKRFWKCAARDGRLQPVHVALYVALCQQWAEHDFISPFPVRRQELMQLAKVASRVTYHRRMRELHRFGYIWYAPSYDYYHGSWVMLLGEPAYACLQREIPNLPIKAMDPVD